MNNSGQRLSESVARLAVGCVETAALLDEHHRHEVEKFIGLAACAKLHETPELFAALMPAKYRFVRHSFDVQMQVQIRRDIGVEGRIEVFGRTITSLFHARFSKTTTVYDRMTVEIAAVPSPSAPPAQV